MARRLTCCSAQIDLECDAFCVVVVYAVEDHSPSVHERLAHLLSSEYGPLLQDMIKRRGIYSTGKVQVEVLWNIWDLDTLENDDVQRRCQLDCGKAFLILADSQSQARAKMFKEEVLDQKDEHDVIVLARQVGNVTSAVLSRELQSFCDYVNDNIGLVVPPKKAVKYVKRNKFQIFLRNIRRFFQKYNRA